MNTTTMKVVAAVALTLLLCIDREVAVTAAIVVSKSKSTITNRLGGMIKRSVLTLVVSSSILLTSIVLTSQQPAFCGSSGDTAIATKMVSGNSNYQVTVNELLQQQQISMVVGLAVLVKESQERKDAMAVEKKERQGDKKELNDMMALEKKERNEQYLTTTLIAAIAAFASLAMISSNK